MLEDRISTQTGNKLSSAEIFYMKCTLKNPKDIWSKFTFVDNSSFDMTKVNSILNQKIISWKRKRQCNEMFWTEIYRGYFIQRI